MGTDHNERIEALRNLKQPVLPNDSMAEAGRKVLLGEFITMLQREVGSRIGTDIEDVHIMRVATRRMRSAYRVLKPYYKPKAIRQFSRQLRQIATALGAVRDLDVLIFDLEAFRAGLDDAGQEAITQLIADLDERRTAARDSLKALLDSKAYRQFVKKYAGFVTQPGEGVIPVKPDSPVPYQVRHILPVLISERLAAVRAYEAVLTDDSVNMDTLHALRIEFKRLRYIISLFDEVLGNRVQEFVTELKVIQDHLGRLNDIASARHRLDLLVDNLDNAYSGVLHTYMESLEAEAPALVSKFPEVWAHFNSRKVQEKLSSAVLKLR
jgi:CHAD domain-containing protein